MPTYTASIHCQPVVVEQLSASELPQYSPRALTIANLNHTVTLPSDTVALAGRTFHRLTSTQTIDLTSVSDPLYGTLNFTGKKLAMLVLRNTGTASASLAQGSSNGYPLPTGTITVPQGGYVFASFVGQGSAVSSSQKTLTATVNSGAIFECLLLFID